MPDERAASSPADRTPEERAADHAEIGRLADQLLPALVAKLSASGLGEIELREGRWRLRVRQPAPGEGLERARRATDGASRSQPGHAGHGHAPAGFEGHRSAREARTPTVHSTNGSTPHLAAVGPGQGNQPEAGRPADSRPGRAVATSPAVGVYQPKSEVTPGTRVRAGDRLGFVDMLGVPQEVVAPEDGLVGASLVEPGQAVEYGQELVVIELVGTPAGEG